MLLQERIDRGVGFGAVETGYASNMARLAHHDRFPYSAITDRPDFSWPDGKRLAIYLGINLESFAFGSGEGAVLASPNPAPDVLNFAWRDYGNRVGVWRMIQLLDDLGLPCTVLPNTAMYHHASPVMEAFRSRGHEVAAHGRTNSEKQGEMSEDEERSLIEEVTAEIESREGTRPKGWLGPFISESMHTPDLLEEAGYEYVLDWAHDEQPVWMQTRSGRILAVPYPQELNDVPQIMGRRAEAPEFARMILDAFELHLAECERRPVVMGIAFHPYLMGQAHRFGHLRDVLRRVVDSADDRVWLTTAGDINTRFRGLGLD